MSTERVAAALLALVCAAFTAGCSSECRGCGMSPGSRVGVVGPDSDYHEFTVGADGCIEFDPGDNSCDEYQTMIPIAVS